MKYLKFIYIPPFFYAATVCFLAIFAAVGMGNLSYFQSGLEFWTIPMDGYVVFERVAGVLIALASLEAVWEDR